MIIIGYMNIDDVVSNKGIYRRNLSVYMIDFLLCREYCFLSVWHCTEEIIGSGGKCAVLVVPQK